PEQGGWTWRTDPQLMLPSPMRLTAEHAVAFPEAITTPTCLVLASEGVMARRELLLERIDRCEHIQTHRLEGGRHLPLEEAAPAVATIIDTFFRSLTCPSRAAGQVWGSGTTPVPTAHGSRSGPLHTRAPWMRKFDAFVEQESPMVAPFTGHWSAAGCRSDRRRCRRRPGDRTFPPRRSGSGARAAGQRTPAGHRQYPQDQQSGARRAGAAGGWLADPRVLAHPRRSQCPRGTGICG